MYPLAGFGSGPSAAEIAREIRFQNKVEEVYSEIKDSGYNQQKVMGYVNSSQSSYTLEALIQATKNGEIDVDEGTGREIWREIVKRYSFKPYNKLNNSEFFKIRELNELCNPPWWRTPVGGGIDFIAALYSLLTFSFYWGGNLKGLLHHKLNMRHLREHFNIEKDRKG